MSFNSFIEQSAVQLTENINDRICDFDFLRSHCCYSIEFDSVNKINIKIINMLCCLNTCFRLRHVFSSRAQGRLSNAQHTLASSFALHIHSRRSIAAREKNIYLFILCYPKFHLSTCVCFDQNKLNSIRSIQLRSIYDGLKNLCMA